MSALDRSMQDEEATARALGAELLDALGPPVAPSIIARLIARVVHALRGCRSEPLCALDPTSGRLVQVGWLCPGCWRETSIDRSGGHR